MILRVILALVWPFLLALRLWRGESLADLGERVGRGGTTGTVIWLHGASNGELASARWLVEDLRQARPELAVRITCNTLTARMMVQGWKLPGVDASLAPLDTGFALGAFLRRAQPKALISLEGEIWPGRLAACVKRSIPVVMLGARMSERSHRRWRRFGGVAELAKVALVSAQDAGSRRRLQDLGVPTGVFVPDVDLKAEAALRQGPVAQRPRAERAGWLLAASTHEGEEEIVLGAFAASGFDHLIIAPRHPSRGAVIAGILAERGIGFVRRSKGAEPGQARVLLADTLGEMDLWYKRCGVCIVGGTFAERGGHTPWEPVRHGCALVHGPSLYNFEAQFAALDAAGGAVSASQETLATVLSRLDGSDQDRMAAAAARVQASNGGGAGLFQTVLQHIPL